MLDMKSLTTQLLFVISLHTIIAFKIANMLTDFYCYLVTDHHHTDSDNGTGMEVSYALNIILCKINF